MDGDGNSELVAMFTSRWPASAPTSPKGQLRVALAGAVKTAAGAWPAFRVPSERFVGYLAERADPALAPLEAVARQHVADLYLACATAQGDPAAVDLFLPRFGPRLRGVIATIDGTSAFVDEVMDELGEALVGDDKRAGKLAQYRGRVPLVTWLEASARRRALTLKGQAKPFDDLAEVAALERRAPGPTAVDHLRLRYPNGFGQAVTEGTQQALTALPPPDASLLRSHLVDDFPLRKLAHIRGVDVNSIARALASARDTVHRHIRAELASKTGLSPEDVDAVMAALFSRVNLGVEATLKAWRPRR